MVLAGVISCLFATSLLAEQAKKAAKKEFQFRGKVEKVDLSAKTFTVTNEKVEGWKGVPQGAGVVDPGAARTTWEAGGPSPTSSSPRGAPGSPPGT